MFKVKPHSKVIEYTVYGADGQEVGKITTDKDGNGSLENLVLGTYTVKETKAPEAYDLDWNTYTVELTYKDQNTDNHSWQR